MYHFYMLVFYFEHFKNVKGYRQQGEHRTCVQVSRRVPRLTSEYIFIDFIVLVLIMKLQPDPHVKGRHVSLTVILHQSSNASFTTFEAIYHYIYRSFIMIYEYTTAYELLKKFRR